MDKELEQELELLTLDELDIVKELVHKLIHTNCNNFVFYRHGVRVAFGDGAKVAFSNGHTSHNGYDEEWDEDEDYC